MFFPHLTPKVNNNYILSLHIMYNFDRLLPGKRRSSVNRVLLFLTILFALAAVALAAVLAITVLKGDHEDDNRGKQTLS